ncbi:hypothetical protein [Microbacterium sp. 3J1]|uniref:hypothetical protein n=1 Tax=Microbacterium sp. 3J1 TaxID=861269 RepID=UPI000A984FF3|nr:hypothetical protein [Microbacterium sp. 3J1]
MAAKRWLSISAVALGVLALAGCSLGAGPADDGIPHDAASGGQTLTEMRSSLDAIPGVVVTEVVGGDKPNVKGNTGYAVSLEIEPGYAIADGAALVDFVVASVWSVREGYMPNARIDIRVRTAPDAAFDVASAAAEAGWVADAAPRPSTYSAASIDVGDAKDQGAKNLERLGSWPGDVPAAPTDITVKE